MPFSTTKNYPSQNVNNAKVEKLCIIPAQIETAKCVFFMQKELCVLKRFKRTSVFIATGERHDKESEMYANTNMLLENMSIIYYSFLLNSVPLPSQRVCTYCCYEVVLLTVSSRKKLKKLLTHTYEDTHHTNIKINVNIIRNHILIVRLCVIPDN